MPDYLRSALLRALTPQQREAVAESYARLFAKCVGLGPTGFGLPLLVPRRSWQRSRLLEHLRFVQRDSVLGDALFGSVMLGAHRALPIWGKLRARAGLLPRRPGPLAVLLLVSVCAAAGTWSVDRVWQRWGEQALEARLPTALGLLNAGYALTVSATARTEALARALTDALTRQGFATSTSASTLDTGAAGPSATAPTDVIAYGSWWARLGAAQVAEQLAWLRYGSTDSAVARHDPSLGFAGIAVQLARPLRGGQQVVFRDRLTRSWRPLDAAKVPATANASVAADRAFEIPLPDMVVIPGGKFLMGSPASEVGRTASEGPQHAVAMARFALGRTEVTFDDYDRFARATGRTLPGDAGFGRGSRPVVDVSWDDAKAYADWLSKQVGETYRLPTEAEWEYAARAGTASAYWWGDAVRRDAVAMANCAGCGPRSDVRQTLPVGQFPANAYGLLDMHGNVYEWTEDCWHMNYEHAPDDGSAWLEANEGDCSARTIRGGSWFFDGEAARSASRIGNPGHYGLKHIGFRLARTLK